MNYFKQLRLNILRNLLGGAHEAGAWAKDASSHIAHSVLIEAIGQNGHLRRGELLLQLECGRKTYNSTAQDSEMHFSLFCCAPW